MWEITACPLCGDGANGLTDSCCGAAAKTAKPQNNQGNSIKFARHRKSVFINLCRYTHVLHRFFFF